MGILRSPSSLVALVLIKDIKAQSPISGVTEEKPVPVRAGVFGANFASNCGVGRKSGRRLPPSTMAVSFSRPAWCEVKWFHGICFVA
jgi:hypothetical protein